MRTRPYSVLAAAPAADPISELNTTPLIDVMLVLLVMFIVTIPITTHKVDLDLGRPPPDIYVEPTSFLLDMDAAGRLRWEGAPVAESELPARLATLQAAGPNAVLHFRADAESRYEDFDRVLASIKRAGIARIGMVENERFAALD